MKLLKILIVPFLLLLSVSTYSQKCKEYESFVGYDEDLDVEFTNLYGNTVYSEGYEVQVYIFIGKTANDERLLFLLYRQDVDEDLVNGFSISEGTKFIITTEDKKVVRLEAKQDQKPSLQKSKNYSSASKSMQTKRKIQVGQIFNIDKEELEILSTLSMEKIIIEFDDSPKRTFIPQKIYKNRAKSNFKCALDNLFQ